VAAAADHPSCTVAGALYTSLLERRLIRFDRDGSEIIGVKKLTCLYTNRRPAPCMMANAAAGFEPGAAISSRESAVARFADFGETDFAYECARFWVRRPT